MYVCMFWFEVCACVLLNSKCLITVVYIICFVCVCERYVHPYTLIQTYIRTHIQTLTDHRSHTPLYTLVYVHTHTHKHVHIQTHKHTITQTHKHTDTYTHRRMHACMYTHIPVELSFEKLDPHHSENEPEQSTKGEHISDGGYRV